MASLVITPEMEADAQRLAQATGQTPVQAVAKAIRRELEAALLPPQKNIAASRATLSRLHSFPIDRSLTDDEILGYDESGVPEQPYLGR